MTTFDLAETDLLLSTTRAVRRRLDLERPVDRDVVLECLDLALQAPTASNSQTWRFLVVDDAETRAELAELYRRVGVDYLRQAAANVDQDPQTHRVYGSALHLAEHLHEVPVHVVPCAVGVPGDTPIGGASFWGSIIPAVWSFQLALRSRGLGSCFTTLHLGFHDEAAELLGIPEGVTQAGLVPVAHTRGTDFVPARRGPAAEVTHFNRWDG